MDYEQEKSMNSIILTFPGIYKRFSNFRLPINQKLGTKLRRY